MKHDRIDVLVLGLGNVLCGDDGAGVAALHRLQRHYEMADGVVATDGGTLGLALLPLVDSADRLVMVDAIRAEGPPGTMVRLDGADVGPAVYERLSPHQIGVSDLLAGAALVGRYPDEIVLVGVVPETIDLGLGRSPQVEARLDELVTAVVVELERLGYPPRPRARAPDEESEVSRALGL